MAFDDARLTPLPPYIAQDESLSDEYQTVYAKPLGSKAAPTAGLHFTEQQLERLGRKHTISEVTLHVGLGTFAPVKDDDIRNHNMHSEWFTIDEKSAAEINAATHRTAVGTTTVRTLESAQMLQNKIIAQSNDTKIFITPGFTFRHVDALITNFHLPKSTLLMLVAAFMGGTEELHRVYRHAIDKNYRFYSFGDAMLIL
jgi:S-adenosylmethionine:tRNA ribosyltransferase-isomerase